MNQKVNMIVVGGSWGGFQASLQIFKELPVDFKIPIILILHRSKESNSDLHTIFNKKIVLNVKEVEEKQPIRGGFIYLAPPNYHVLIEKEQTFSLDDSELENYSRPSIDVTFYNAVDVYGPQTLGILLSGASKDGSLGLRYIMEKGGTTIVQNPSEAEAKTMPQAAIDIIPNCQILRVKEIKDYLLALQ